MDFFERAKKVMPGGVNSPARTFAGVGGSPPFAASALGPRLKTIDGDELVSALGATVADVTDPE